MKIKPMYCKEKIFSVMSHGLCDKGRLTQKLFLFTIFHSYARDTVHVQSPKSTHLRANSE
jgi:hypothetical protein